MNSDDEESLVVDCSTAEAEPLRDGLPTPTQVELDWVACAPLEVALRSLARGQKTAASLVVRARIVLMVALGGRSRRSVALEVGVTRDTVALWADRFTANPCLEALEDLPRTGRIPRIVLQDQAVVLALAYTSGGGFELDLDYMWSDMNVSTNSLASSGEYRGWTLAVANNNTESVTLTVTAICLDVY